MEATAKRYTTEQIITKLREAEKLQAQGLTISPLYNRGRGRQMPGRTRARPESLGNNFAVGQSGPAQIDVGEGYSGDRP